MSYKFHKLERLNKTNPNLVDKTIIFNDVPPTVEGFHVLPRQHFKVVEMEKGTVNLDYGIDEAVWEIKITCEMVPEFLMKFYEEEYVSEEAVNAIYHITNHRGLKAPVKWKSFSATLISTLPPSDAASAFPYYKQVAESLEPSVELDENDPFFYEIADIYKVVMEFAWCP